MSLLNPSKTSICPAFETSSHRMCSVKKEFLKFRKFHRKHLRWSLFNKIAGLQACNVIKTMLQHRYFLWNLQYLLRVPILKNICKRLLLEKDVVKGFQKIYSVGRLWMVGFFSFNFDCFQLFQSVFSLFQFI